jgi:hypothetical protein
VLRTRGLRQMANRMAYRDKARLATEDAMRIGRLHTHCPGAHLRTPARSFGSATEQPEAALGLGRARCSERGGRIPAPARDFLL